MNDNTLAPAIEYAPSAWFARAPRVFLPANVFVGWLLDAAITPERCAALLADLTARGFAPTGDRYPADYRDNDRLVFDDAALAAELFALLGARIPRTLADDGATWELCGLNTRFRACRYTGGQGFCIHRDGPHVPCDDVRSFLTVQLYLDDDPARVGGRTRFYGDPRGEAQWASIAPTRGTAIVFDHRAWHDGEPVTAGEKHVLRTDAMYRRAASGHIARTSSSAVAPTSPSVVAASPAVGAASPAVVAASPAGVAASPAGVAASPPSLAGPSSSSVLGRHRGYAWRAIALPDGSIASAGRDGTIRVWRAPDRVPRRHDGNAIDIARGSIVALACANDGALWAGTRGGAIVRVASNARAAPGDGATFDHRAAILDGAPIFDHRAAILDGAPIFNHSAAILSLAAHGPRMLASTAAGDIHTFASDGTLLSTTRAHDGWAWSVIAHDDGFWSCGHDGRVTRDGRELVALGAPLRAIALLRNTSRMDAAFVVGDTRGWLHYLARDGRVVAATRAHAAAITSLAVHDDIVISGGEDGAVTRWCDRRALSTTHVTDFVTSVAVAGEHVIVAGYDGTISAYALPTG